MVGTPLAVQFTYQINENDRIAAGEVKARGDRPRARSDCIAIKCKRAISVSASVMNDDDPEIAFLACHIPDPWCLLKRLDMQASDRLCG
jgi:hypothetical protein